MATGKRMALIGKLKYKEKSGIGLKKKKENGRGGENSFSYGMLE